MSIEFCREREKNKYKEHNGVIVNFNICEIIQ